MSFQKQQFATVIIALSLLSLFCFLFNRLNHGSFLGSFFKKQNKYVFLPEEFVVKEERKQQAEKEVVYATSSVRVPIFVYHSVRPHLDKETVLQDAYDVTPELFEKQLQYLRDNNYSVITMKELNKFMDKTEKKDISKKQVVLSFDDGWENQYTYAYPLLKKYDMTAIFYVYTQPLGYKHFLSWSQLQEMSAAGMEIGSHTLTHPLFKNVGESELTHEIVDSKKELEKKIGLPIYDFAAPFGYSNAHIESVVESAGYKSGRTIYRGAYQKNKYSLRGNLVSDDMKDFIEVLQEK